ncbi:hypothetical protein ACQ4M3_32825 [Leptolyngbya sp. AN03gr2]|uniref:hypothetical protein n=1 Tax=unclassified Leptolyngbya TaxID=2650499 RepID=UPI003D31E50A
MLPFLLSVVPEMNLSSNIPDQNSSIPTVVIERDQVRTLTPDWTRLTFAKLPTLAQPGSLWGRNWSVGQKLEDVLTLGDFQNSLKLQDLNLYAISLATQTSPKAVLLSHFHLLEQQTLTSLANAIPALDQYPINEIKPLVALLHSAKSGYRLMEETLPELLRQDPSLGALNFQITDSKYTLEDIPGLLEVPLQAFEHWQEAKISDIPGLPQTPWKFFPDPPNDDGVSGLVQIPSQSAKSANIKAEAISGSDVVGYQMACQTCAGISFSSPPLLQGKRWISGSTQWIQGGTGESTSTENSYEPTGRNVFGKAFKVVITEFTPKEVQTALYFRFCQAEPNRNQVNCSPYAVGAVPFLLYHSGDAMLVGNMDVKTAATPQILPVPQPIQAEASNPSSSFQTSMLKFLTQAIDKIKAILRFSPTV